MQKAWSFDRETIKNIVKGAMHAAIVSSLLGILDFVSSQVGMIQSSNILVVMGVSWFTQAGYNTIRQYIKGI